MDPPDVDVILKQLNEVRARLEQTPANATAERSWLIDELHELRAEAARLRNPTPAKRPVQSAADLARQRMEEKRAQRRKSNVIAFVIFVIVAVVAVAQLQEGEPEMAFVLVIGLGFTTVWMLYFMPVFIARHRDTANFGGVFAVNLLLGWTLIGWIVALSMAASGETKEQLAARMTPPGRPSLSPSPMDLRVGQLAVVARAPAAIGWTMPWKVGVEEGMPIPCNLVVKVVGKAGQMVKLQLPGGRSAWVDDAAVNPP